MVFIAYLGVLVILLLARHREWHDMAAVAALIIAVSNIHDAFMQESMFLRAFILAVGAYFILVAAGHGLAWRKSWSKGPEDTPKS
jgi:hypothetical protein